MALKIVYKICHGIDVHKTFVVAFITSTDSKGVITYESPPELRDTIDGYITPEQSGKLKIMKALYENRQSRKANQGSGKSLHLIFNLPSTRST